MSRRLIIAFILTASFALLLACQPAPTTNTTPVANTATTPAASPTAEAKKTAPTNLDELAGRLVNQSAGVKEGEIVLVAGGVRDLELLEDIATEVRKVGAFPLVSINSDRMTKRSYADVPEKYDTQEPKLDDKLADTLNVIIGVDSSETEGMLADVQNIASRRAARGKAGAAVGKKFLDKNIRQVSVGNDLYPTSWRAQRYGMSQDELAKTFWEGVNVDYTSLQAKSEQVKQALSAGKELHITNAATGTDLTLDISGRPYVTSDGIISPEDVKKGGAAVAVFLPAGEVMTTPVPGKANGKVVVEKTYFDGKEVQNLTLQFVNGKVTSMSGSGPGYDSLKAQYDAAGEGKDAFAFVDFGVNDKVHLSPSSKLGTWVPAGMVTIGIGNNIGFGGDNNTNFGMSGFLSGTTVTLDGKTIIENGQLKI
ncbi:MAG: aminopeptidase [Acidobacteria bacterium]|nr:aminopeptidase [Acidobacteriota bacterium]